MISELKKTLAVFTPKERRKAALILVLVVFMAAAETAGVVSIMPFLSVLARPSIIEENPLFLAAYQYFKFNESKEFILALGLVSIGAVVASSAYKTITLHIVNRFVHFERHSISSRLLSRYLHQPYEFFLTHNSAVLAKNVLAEVDMLMFNLIQPMSQLIAQGSVLIAMALLVLLYDPTTALCIVVALLLLYSVIFGLVRKRLSLIGLDRQLADGQRYQACAEALGGIKDVKVTHSSDAYLQKYAEASRLLARHLAANDTLSQSPLYIVEAVGYTGLIIIALALLMRSNDIAHVLPALGLYGFAAYRMLPAAQIIYRGLARLKFASAALDSIHQDLMLPEEFATVSGDTLPLRHEIRLQGIHFAYPSAPEKPILYNFDLVIPANSSLGIMGKSGAGKSTLMDILLGLLTPQAGKLMVDGVEITSSNVAAWQRNIGYVPQHIYLSDASVAENIAFGLSRQQIDLSKLERAARAAQIHEFIVRELPQGYDTTIGDRGVRLSGGQRQRIGIARALYRDPPVLFFDEATSALDFETEEAVNEAIESQSGRKTIIVIAHKEASLRYCRQVVSIASESEFMGSRKTTLKGGLKNEENVPLY